MRKIAALFVLMMTFSMVFAGAVSAADVEVNVVEEDLTPVEVTCPGDTVIIAVDADATEDIVIDGQVNITVEPETGLLVIPESAEMTYDGINWISNLDPILGGFFYEGPTGEWIWDVGTLVDEQALLFVGAIVTDVGPITVNANFTDAYLQEELDFDSYTFLSVPCPPPCHGATVPMQATGSPLAVAALGLLSIIGGAVYGKLR